MNSPHDSPVPALLPEAHAGVPRPAATIVLARDGAQGIEVLMLRRSAELAFAPGAHVFPGGAVDPSDATIAMASRCVGLTSAQASERLATGADALSYYIAAVRECFEESGVLLAHRRNGAALTAGEAAALAAARTTPFGEILAANDLVLALDTIEYFAHWNTQAGRPRRFTTRFFVAAMPENQSAAHDDGETVDTVWMRPRDALAAYAKGDMELLFPTYKSLQLLRDYASVTALMNFVRARVPPRLGSPRIARTKAGARTVYSGDFSYAEIAKLDPEARGTAWCEIRPDEIVTVAPGVRRLTAPNPSMMTGPGTNTYLIGDAASGIAVIDPGPALDAHVDRIVTLAAGEIRWIACTHTHMDHSPAVALLQARTGARTYGIPAPAHGAQDATFAPAHVVVDGERLSLAGRLVRVLHTPGHASNQICYLLEDERILFTGDHLMQGSTVVINPPDGDMRAYFDHLERLYRESIDFIAPGHGFLMGAAHEAVERVILHRLAREKKVIAALAALGRADEPALLPLVYNDTPQALHALAARSLLAHLIKLLRDGRVREHGGQWQLERSTRSAT